MRQVPHVHAIRAHGAALLLQLARAQPQRTQARPFQRRHASRAARPWPPERLTQAFLAVIL